MLNLNPPSSLINPEVDTLCQHVKEIAIQTKETAATSDELKVSPLTPPSPMETNGDDEGFYSDEECKTPRGEEHKIPEITTCPPAPKRLKNTRSLLLSEAAATFKLDSPEIMHQDLLMEPHDGDDGDLLIQQSEINWLAGASS